MEAVAVESRLMENPVEIKIKYWTYVDEKFPNSNGKKVIELEVGQESLFPQLCNKFGEKVSCMELGDWFVRNNKIINGLVAGELQNLPIASNSVDIVISMYPFQKQAEFKRTAEEIERVMRSGGQALMIVTNENYRDGKLGIESGLEVAEYREIPPADGRDTMWVLSLKKK